MAYAEETTDNEDSAVHESAADDESTDEEAVDEETADEEEKEEAEPADEEEPPTTDRAVSDKKEVEFDAGEKFILNIMHMNDTHAHVENYPKLQTLAKAYRAEHEDALFFHGGDVFSGTLYFNEFKGQADLAMLNKMGLDAMVFGNHEFDLGEKEEGHESLAKFVENANFPILGTNVDLSKDPFMAKYGETEKVPNTLVLERGGEKIGVFGLTTPDTANIASPMAVEFIDYIESAKKAVAELKDQGINKIIAVTHIGYNSAPQAGNDLLLADNVKDIDIIVGGHSHSKVTPPVVVNEETDNPTVIVQAGQYAENLGTLEVTFDPDGKVIDQKGELQPIKEVEGDPELLEILKPYKEKVDELNNSEIGAVAEKDLENPRQEGGKPGDSVRANETPLGNLVTDAMLAKAQTKYPDTVIAMQNGGGIREAIAKGPITSGEVIAVLPFGNNPVIVDLSGQEIVDLLEASVRNAPLENGGFLHVSGLKFYYDSTKEVGQRVVKVLVKIDGEYQEIELDKKYGVTTNGFTGRGGDDLDVFKKADEQGRVKDIGEVDWMQLRDYMVENLGGHVNPEVEGRIIDLKGEAFEDPDAEKPGSLEDQIKALEARLDKLAAENADMKEKVAAIRKELATIKAELKAANANIAELEEQLAKCEKETDACEKTEANDSEADAKADQDSTQTPTTGQKTQVKPVQKPGQSLPKAGAETVLPMISGITFILTGLSAAFSSRKED